jgi:hypothetical protein
LAERRAPSPVRRCRRPGATFTVAAGISSSGEIVGYYSNSAGVGHGFLLNNEIYSSIDFPLATSTFALGINDAGDIAGEYDDANGQVHGFTDSGGVFNQVDVAGAADTDLYRIKNNEVGTASAGKSLSLLESKVRSPHFIHSCDVV